MLRSLTTTENAQRSAAAGSTSTELRSVPRLNGRPAGRNRFDRIAASVAGALLLLAGSGILMGIITGEALFPAPYNTAENTISDLGSTWQPGDIVREPSATIFNTTMLVTGLMIAVAALCLYRAKRRRAVAIPLSLLGLSVFAVGIFPGTEINGEPSTSGVHPIVSMLAFLSGAVAAILAYRITASPFRYLSAILGAVALIALFASGVLGDTSLGVGGVERWVAYPTVLWLVAFGGYILGERPTKSGPRTIEAVS